ncbi:ANTAR domain-containing protein [Pseudonocardia sp. C8]|uniref:ANTAR domain-containing protein n=1 Tax=Pseudonocardia sp. C8 TaxID=2762759 RepID=UPI0016425DCC|nr:ANTAR domain-containing protein [Pseudonocardia sp. C8]MBC3192251.1 ANTAR domain-containing protein [Pseudonocardia sp. C8]
MPPDSRQSLQQVVRGCVATLGVDGAGLTAIGSRDERVHLAATGPATLRIADLQQVTGTGPCWDASTTHRPAHGPDLAAAVEQARWPGFAAAAVERGTRAVFAFPVLAGAVCCGTLLLCRQRPGPLTPAQIRDGLGFAESGLWALLDLRAGVPTDRPVAPFGAGQDEVFQASGVIAAQLGTGVDDALVLLRAHALAAGRPLTEAAADVVAHRLRFAPDRTGSAGDHGSTE